MKSKANIYFCTCSVVVDGVNIPLGLFVYSPIWVLFRYSKTNYEQCKHLLLESDVQGFESMEHAGWDDCLMNSIDNFQSYQSAYLKRDAGLKYSKPKQLECKRLSKEAFQAMFNKLILQK